MALLHYFYTHASAYGIKICAVNCEHGIRGEASLADSAFVKSLCENWDVPLLEYSADCLALSKERKVSLETAARDFRYECFDRILQDDRADFIATAHHREDNAETVLFNICRGASLTGASGISERKGYIRPLLSVAKEDILKYIQENNLSYRQDKTNEDESITRNAVRLKVLPTLERIIPGATSGIVRFSALAKEDDALLYELAKPLLQNFDWGVKVSFSSQKPLFCRACLLALKRLGVEKDYTLAHLELLYALQTAENGARASMPENIIGVREYDGVALYRPQNRIQEEIPFNLGSFTLGKTTVVVTSCEERRQGEGEYLDLNEIPSTAVFRTRREGDVFTKFGGGSKKLKDYLIDKKIPVRERDELIVLADGKEILAIVGVEISDKVKVKEKSKIIKLTIQKKGE